MRNETLFPMLTSQIIRFTAMLALILFGSAFTMAAAAGLDSTNHTLTVMTYNLRFASSNPPNAWPQRRQLMREVIRSVGPDIMGTQEGLYGQLKELASAMPEFDWIGLGREGGSKGEFAAIFYLKARVEPLAFDHFWLSDTPEVIGSTTWGNTYRRMVTWVKFRDWKTGGEFFVFNVHFDNDSQSAREKSAALVRKRVEALETKLPVLVIGDFNCAAESDPVYKILTADTVFRDAWLVASQRQGAGVGTFNDFKRAEPNGPRIDWILTRGETSVEHAETVTFSRDGHFPSDHFPVVARLRLSQGK